MTIDRLPQMRAEMRSAAMREPVRTHLDSVVDLTADGVPARLYRPARGAPVALYVHGGGWVLHDLETHDAFCRYLAQRTGWAMLAVDYRLAPEHPYPAPLDDVETAASWLRAHADRLEVDGAWIPAIGDSSGANLVAGLGVRAPAAVDFHVLVYPPVDAALADVDEDNAILSAASMARFWDAYAPGDAADHPEVCVLRADVRRQPPTLVITAEHDVLCGQGEAYAAALVEVGVDVTALRATGMVHSFWRQPEMFAASRSCVITVGSLLDAARAAAGRA